MDNVLGYVQFTTKSIPPGLGMEGKDVPVWVAAGKISFFKPQDGGTFIQLDCGTALIVIETLEDVEQKMLGFYS